MTIKYLWGVEVARSEDPNLRNNLETFCNSFYCFFAIQLQFWNLNELLEFLNRMVEVAVTNCRIKIHKLCLCFQLFEICLAEWWAWEEIKKVVCFWQQRGVGGRARALFQFLFEILEFNFNKKKIPSRSGKHSTLLVWSGLVSVSVSVIFDIL